MSRQLFQRIGSAGVFAAWEAEPSLRHGATEVTLALLQALPVKTAEAASYCAAFRLAFRYIPLHACPLLLQADTHKLLLQYRRPSLTSVGFPDRRPEFGDTHRIRRARGIRKVVGQITFV
jgi:hypothetical protein